MGFKKIMLVAFLFLAILTIGSVSAAGDNSTSLTAGEDLIVESLDDEVLSTGEGTFSDLSTLINNTPENGTLELDKDYINNGSESEITISKSMTIDGKGHTLDADGKSRVFNIQSGTVILKNIVFKNGYTNNDGGAVYFLRDGTVENCNFTNNQATDYMSAGGAVCMDSGAVENCNFVNNTAYYGGAIRFYSDGNVTNCNFTDNQASYDGGAVSSDNCNVANCNFTNNSGVYGGAVNSNNANVTNCNFTNNVATSYYSAGGAVYIGSGTVANCNFTDNSAGNGGAVCFWSDGELTNCTFVNNTVAFLDGGAVHMGSGNVTNCNFTNNSAGRRGGAILFSGDGNVTDCTFVNNSGAYGGAVCLNNGNVTNCNFTNNVATSYYSDGGGAIHMGSGNVTNCNFTNNAAGNMGGAILFTGEGNVTDCTFVNNAASNGDGGAILIYSGTVENCTFVNNTANGIGGAICFNSKGNITACNFTGNTEPQFFNPAQGSLNTTMVIETNATELHLGEDISITVKVFDQNTEILNGNIELFVNSASMGTKTIGEAFTYAPTEIGNYIIEANFTETSNYTGCSNFTSFTVIANVTPANPKNETKTLLLVNSANVYLGDNITVTAIVSNQNSEILAGTVDVYVNSVFLGSKNINEAFAYAPDKTGKYVIEARFNGTSDYNASSSGVTVNVIENVVPETMKSDDDGIIILEFPAGAEGEVEVFINGVSVKIVKIVNGIAVIDLSKYKGNYTFSFVYSGDGNYSGFTRQSNVTVIVNPAKITAVNTKVLYTAGQKFTVTVYGDENTAAKSVPVEFKVNGKKFTAANTNSKGIAGFKVTQTPGTYKVEASALGKTVTKTLTVKHLVTLKKVTVKRFAKKLVLTATLSKVNKKYLKNKKVTFKFNGKKYTAKTNKKGVAKVTVKSSVLKKLKAGKKVTYQATYLKDTVKKTVKVKK